MSNVAYSNNEIYDNNTNFLIKVKKEYIDNNLRQFEHSTPIFDEISEINEEKTIDFNTNNDLIQISKQFYQTNNNNQTKDGVVEPESVTIQINMASPTAKVQDDTTLIAVSKITTQPSTQCEFLNNDTTNTAPSLTSIEQQSCAQDRYIFKKSHTCGSLFAKCHCDDNVELSGNNQIYTDNIEDIIIQNRKFSSDTIHFTRQVTQNNNCYEQNVDNRTDISSSPGRSNSLDDSTLSRKTTTHTNRQDLTQCDGSNKKVKSRKSSSTKTSFSTPQNTTDQSFPTYDHIAVAKICEENPDVCLKHPEFPFPIPPSDWWYKHVENLKSGAEIKSTTVNNKNSRSSSTDDTTNTTTKQQKQHVVDNTSSPPLSLTQILQTRDYVPPFQEIFPKINLREGYSRSSIDNQSPATTITSSSSSYTHQNTTNKQNYYDNPAELYFKESGIIGPMNMGNGISSTTAGGRKTSRKLSSQESVTSSVTNVTSAIRKNSKILIDTAKKRSSQLSQDDYDYLKTIVPHLRKEVHDWEEKAKKLELEILDIKQKLLRRDSQVIKLQREIHKLKSVLNQTLLTQDGNDILASLQEQHGMANRNYTIHGTLSNNNISTNAKKQGVSAESSHSSLGQQPSEIQIVRYEKDFRSKQLIKDAIMDNDFLKKLDSSQVRELVDSMYQKEYEAGSYVIREGEAGAHLFVSASGEFEVIKDNIVLGKMGPGKAFGELAILYNCTRTASIRVIVDSKVWVLDRRVFQQIMMRTGLQRLQDNINFLQSVPLLRNLSNDVLAKIADVLEVEFYPADAYIIRQGASGDTFFIISGGTVKVTQRLPGSNEEEEIRILQRGDYFGEQALLKEDCRTASIIALHPGVECLTLDRESFIQLIGDLSELIEKDYGDEQRALSRPNSSVSVNSEGGQEFDHIKLDDLDVIATLGVGGFGRVELVQYAYDRSQTFALKCLKKQHIVDTHQQEHIFSEKNIMMNCRNPFICRMYKTFKDKKYVYMLLEACLGGEVWTILKERSYFDDHTTRFITACVIEAFDYLHSKGIIYRDLKPENLLLDNRGYVKLVDFGFSKKIGFGTKTWTFCGTPEYVAPETILNKGHDRAVDYWALGILMHELLTGTPPFTAADPMKTYNIILKGIDMIDFPKHVTRTAQSLIKRLCRDSPSERLGYQRGGIQDIKKHKWFQGFDWDGLKNRTMTPPIVQTVRGPCDTSNFECFSKDNDIPPDELSNWDADF